MILNVYKNSQACIEIIARHILQAKVAEFAVSASIRECPSVSEGVNATLKLPNGAVIYTKTEERTICDKFGVGWSFISEPYGVPPSTIKVTYRSLLMD